MMLTETTRQAILDLQKQYPVARSALIPALHIAQAEIGFLPIEIQKEIALLFNIALTEVHGVVSFYDMFHEHPMGKHHLHVCKNISCMLRGGDEVLENLCAHLRIKPGETSADGEFTVIPSECLGACDKAPMWIVDDKVVGPIAEKDIEQILQEARHG